MWMAELNRYTGILQIHTIALALVYVDYSGNHWKQVVTGAGT
jgi:hypothetical protein